MPRGAPTKYGITVTGAEDLLRRLAEEHLLGKPVRQFFTKFGQIGKDEAQQGAARNSGRMRSSITRRLSAKKIPSFVAIRVGATNSRGYSYPRLLEFSPHHHHQGWLMKAMEKAMAGIGSLMDDAARDIETQFSAGL